MKCPRCSAEMPQYQDADGGTYEACTCRTAKPPTLAELVLLAVGGGVPRKGQAPDRGDPAGVRAGGAAGADARDRPGHGGRGARGARCVVAQEAGRVGCDHRLWSGPGSDPGAVLFPQRVESLWTIRIRADFRHEISARTLRGFLAFLRFSHGETQRSRPVGYSRRLYICARKMRQAARGHLNNVSVPPHVATAADPSGKRFGWPTPAERWRHGAGTVFLRGVGWTVPTFAWQRDCAAIAK